MSPDLLSLLAFGFATPWMLLGLALGSIPIIIHLLHRRKYQEMNWAAMRFLLAAVRKQSRRMRLEQLLLLLVRSLLVAFLVLAMAQPFVESLGSFFEVSGPTHRLIVIDTSLSMGYRPAEQTRFEQAKNMARKIVSSAPQGDLFQLVRIGQTEPRVIISRPARQKAEVIAEIDQLELSNEFGEVAGTLQELPQLLKEQTEINRRELYLISDFQRSNWQENLTQVQAQLAEVAEQAELVLLDLGQPDSPNTALIDFRAETPFVVVNQPTPLRVTVQNTGDLPTQRQTLELLVDGRKIEEKIVTLASGETEDFFFNPVFTPRGGQTIDSQEQKLEVRLSEDLLDLDNHRRLSLPAKHHLNILLVNGRQSGTPSDWTTHYVQFALAPNVTGETWEGTFQPRVISRIELPGTDLSRFDCVCLCNVPLITPQESIVLESYVESGGALVISLGDQVNLRNYNQNLYQDGEGILPARLIDYVGNAEEPRENEITTFDPAELKHPILRVFQGNPGTGLDTTLTLRYVKTSIPENSRASVVLKFATGDPAILEAPVGRGRCLLITTSLDNSWSTWARESSSFAPVLHEIMKFMVSGQWIERQVQVGEPIVRAFPTRNFSIPVQMRTPSGNEQSWELSQMGSSAQIYFDETGQDGFYQLDVGPPINRSEVYAVNLDPRESNLAKLDPEELKQELLPGIEYRYLTNWENSPEESELSGTSRGGLTRWLLLATLCLLIIEQLMAWRFLIGFLALCGLIAYACCFQTILWNVWTGWLLFVGVLLVLGVLVQVVWPARLPQI